VAVVPDEDDAGDEVGTVGIRWCHTLVMTRAPDPKGPPGGLPEGAEHLWNEAFADFNAYLNRWPSAANPDDPDESAEWTGEGPWLWDLRGRRFLDFLGGFGIFSFGHRHPRIVAEVAEQLGRLPLHSQWLRNPVAARAGRKLAAITPKEPGRELRKTFFCNSGTEAVEGALKLARLATGRKKLVSMERSFHGKSMGSLSVTGRARFRDPVAPLLAGVTFVPFGDAAALRAAVDRETAAVIVEPLQGEGGVHPAPPGYLQEVRKACDAVGALMIADEVQTGMGRTGRLFGVDHAGVVPDIMALGKALGGGVVACGAFTSTDELWKAFHPMPLFHTSTFGHNPLATRAASAAIDVLVEERLERKAAETGEWLLGELRVRVGRWERWLREARGLGLLLGLECVNEEVGSKLAQGLFRRDVLVAHTLNNPSVIRLEPMLGIPRELCVDFLARLDDALAALG
jgi:putrescine aminotransferase